MGLDQTIQSLLDEATSDATSGIPGAVFVAVDRTGAQLAANASGVRGLTEKAPMTLDTIFYLASCTKLVTTIAALQLVELGFIRLDDASQVKEFLPELNNTRVIDSTGKPGDVRKNDITVRMLLSHTAGYGYHFFNTTLRDSDTPLPRGVEAHLAEPILFEPGTSWEYGINLDILGIFMERVTKQTLEAYFRKNIFDPLDIKDFSFYVPKTDMSRLVRIHLRGADGTLQQIPHPIPVVAEGEAEIMRNGGSGGFTTMVDYVKVLATVLNEGVSPTTKQRVLGKEMAKFMASNQVPHLPDFARKGLAGAIPVLSNDVPELYPQLGNPPQGWSLAGLLNLEANATTGRKKNSVFWCGTSNLYWWADAETGIAGILATQILPFWDAQALKLREQIEKAVYDHLE